MRSAGNRPSGPRNTASVGRCACLLALGLAGTVLLAPPGLAANAGLVSQALAVTSLRADAPSGPISGVPIEDRPREWLVRVPSSVMLEQNPLAMTRENLLRGEALYRGLCVACHGPRGLGEASNPIFRALRPKPLHHAGRPTLPDGVARWVIHNGIDSTPMKALTRMVSEEDSWYLVSYLHALARPWLLKVPAATLAQGNPHAASAASVESGRAAYESLCVACHGPTGLGDSTHPFFAALRPKPLHALGRVTLPDGVINWVVANGVEGTAMKALRQMLSDDDAWHVVNYLHSMAAAERR